MGGDDRTDVLVIGAGAAGAAVAWMLARAGVGVVCLEQGDWVDPRAFPHWRGRLGAASPHRLERRAQRAAAPPGLSGQRRGLADRAADVQRRGRQHDPLERPLPALPPLGLPREEPRRRGRRLADRLRHAGAVLRPERPHDGRGRGHRRPRLSPEVAAADAADPARHARGDDGPGLRSPRLALVAVGQRHPHARLRRPPRLHQLRPVRPRLPDRGEGEHRHHLLAQGAGLRRAAPRRTPACARSRSARTGAPTGRSTTTRGAPLRAEGARGGPGRQRDRHAAAPAELALGAVSRRAGQPERAGRPEPHVPSLRDRARRLRRAARRVPRPHRLQHHQPGVLRDRSLARVRARLLVPGRPGALADRLGARADRSATACRGVASTVAPTTTLFDRTITVAVIGEDLPEPENRVDLDPALTDGHGIPAPRVSYTLSENSRRMLDHGIARASEALEAAGARAGRPPIRSCEPGAGT